MAKVPREKPVHLARKLKEIRVRLGYSQNELLNALGMSGKQDRSSISGYEIGSKEPTLPVLLKYARLIDVSTDLLIDDSLDI